MHSSQGATALLAMDGFVVGAQADVDGELWLNVETTAWRPLRRGGRRLPGPRSCCARCTPPPTPSRREVVSTPSTSTAAEPTSPELTRLSRTIRRWQPQVLASHATALTNGPTEAVSLLKKVKRVGHGFRNFENYRLRLLLHCGV